MICCSFDICLGRYRKQTLCNFKEIQGPLVLNQGSTFISISSSFIYKMVRFDAYGFKIIFQKIEMSKTVNQLESKRHLVFILKNEL